MGVLFLGFGFLSGFSESLITISFLLCWAAWLVCSQGMPAGVKRLRCIDVIEREVRQAGMVPVVHRIHEWRRKALAGEILQF